MPRIISLIYTVIILPMFSSCQTLPDPLPKDFELELFGGGGMLPQWHTYKWSKNAFFYEENWGEKYKINFEVKVDESDTLLQLLKDAKFSSIKIEETNYMRHDYPSSGVRLNIPSLKYSKEIAGGARQEVAERYKKKFKELYKSLTNMAEKHFENHSQSFIITWTSEIIDSFSQVSFYKSNWPTKSDTLQSILSIVPGQYTLHLNGYPNTSGAIYNFIDLPLEIKREHTGLNIYRDEKGQIQAQLIPSIK